MKLDSTRIEVLLAEQGLSKAKYAEKCEISRQTVSTVLRRGSCEPVTAGKLANGLGVPVSEIVQE